MPRRWEPDSDLRRGVDVPLRRPASVELHALPVVEDPVPGEQLSTPFMLIWSSHRSIGAARSPTRSWCAARRSCGTTGFGAELTEFNGEADHVHLLVHYPPKVALSRLVGSLKGVSARRLRQEFPSHIRKYLWGDHFWSPSYFAVSAGGAPLKVIKEYIENQKRPG
jgi:REP element-mobilizing transposase RayT